MWPSLVKSQTCSNSNGQSKSPSKHRRLISSTTAMLPSGATLHGTHSPAGLLGLRYSGRVSQTQRRNKRQHSHLCRAVLAVPAPPRQLEQPQQPSKAPQPQVPRARRMPELLHSRCTALSPTLFGCRSQRAATTSCFVVATPQLAAVNVAYFSCMLGKPIQRMLLCNAALQCRNLRNLICQPLHHSH